MFFVGAQPDGRPRLTIQEELAILTDTQLAMTVPNYYYAGTSPSVLSDEDFDVIRGAPAFVVEEYGRERRRLRADIDPFNGYTLFRTGLVGGESKFFGF